MARARLVAAALGALVVACGCGAPGLRQERTPQPHRIASINAGTTSAPASAASSVRVPARHRLLAYGRSPRHGPRWASGAGAPAFPVPGDVDQRSADAVALAGAVAMASADTAVDRSGPQHTAVRVAWAGWLTPQFAHRVLTAHIVGPPGVQWDTWCRHRAYVVVRAHPSGEDHPPDTATVAARKVVLREQVIGRDGWHTAMTTVVVAVVVRKIHEVWRIDSDQSS